MAHEAQTMIEYSDQPSVLILADGDEAAQRARRSAELAGCRISDSIALADAAERLSRQAAADAVFLEVEADHGQMLIDVLGAIDAAAAAGRHGSVISAPFSLIDLIAARTSHERVVHLCDADEAERVAAISLLSAKRKHRLHDISKEDAPRRLDEISEQVGRIANLLASLSAAGGDLAPPSEVSGAEDEAPSVTPGEVRAIIRARRTREQFFGTDLFSDPAWDILLDLYAARLEKRRVAVSSLCIAAAVPSTTALRWIKSLTDVGLLARAADPQDGRRVYIELAPDTALRLHGYFKAVARLSPIAI